MSGKCETCHEHYIGETQEFFPFARKNMNKNLLLLNRHAIYKLTVTTVAFFQVYMYLSMYIYV